MRPPSQHRVRVHIHGHPHGVAGFEGRVVQHRPQGAMDRADGGGLEQDHPAEALVDALAGRLGRPRHLDAAPGGRPQPSGEVPGHALRRAVALRGDPHQGVAGEGRGAGGLRTVPGRSRTAANPALVTCSDAPWACSSCSWRDWAVTPSKHPFGQGLSPQARIEDWELPVLDTERAFIEGGRGRGALHPPPCIVYRPGGKGAGGRGRRGRGPLTPSHVSAIHT